MNTAQPSQEALRDMVRTYVGDGGTPNMFFITLSPHVRIYNQFGDWDYELADGANHDDFTHYGPYMDYATARKAFDEVELYGTETSVMLEDRKTGTIVERSLEKVIVTEYHETCYDDAKRYGYE